MHDSQQADARSRRTADAIECLSGADGGVFMSAETSHDFAARRLKTPIRTHIGPIDTCTVEETVAEPSVL